MTGRYRVRVLRAAFHDAHHWLPRMRDRAELRRHALKLRFWPDNHPVDEGGFVLDLNWSWIVALRGRHVGELRIQDNIGERNNLRVIFFKPESQVPHPIIWVLAVLQKKRDDFTTAQIRSFNARRTIVLERFYNT